MKKKDLKLDNGGYSPSPSITTGKLRLSVPCILPLGEILSYAVVLAIETFWNLVSKCVINPLLSIPVFSIKEVRDYFFTSILQEEKKISEEQSSKVNEAYNTLLKPLSRGIYLVSLTNYEQIQDLMKGD